MTLETRGSLYFFFDHHNKDGRSPCSQIDLVKLQFGTPYPRTKFILKCLTSTVKLDNLNHLNLEFGPIFILGSNTTRNLGLSP